MKKQAIFNYQDGKTQRDTCFSFLESVQNITNTKIVNLENIKKYSTVDLISFVISSFDNLLCDEMRVHTPPFSGWTDSAAGYYRSDSQKMELIKEILGRENINVEGSYTYLGPKVHIKYYANIYGGKIIELTPLYDVLILENSKPEPILGIPRQDIFAEFIKCGFNPLSEVSVENEGKKKSVSTKEIDSKKDTELVTPNIQNITKFYEKQFGEEVVVIPFASGTSANEAVIKAISLEKDVKTVNVHPYWYYENIPSVERFFKGKISNQASESNLFFINLEPTNFLNLEYEKHITSPIELLWKIQCWAQNNKEKTYYVVIDNTVDPLGNKSLLRDLIKMENVKVITTSSLSKHQNGNRKYFFGIVCLYNKSLKLQKSIEEKKLLVNGALSNFQKKEFPELNPDKMQARISYVKKLNHEVESCFDSEFFFSVALTFNTLVYPKVSPIAIKDINYIEYNSSLENIVKSIVLRFNNPDFEYGDSFGLAKTRVIVQGDDDSFHLPRLSPGFNCSSDEICTFTQYFSKELSKFEYLPDVC